MGPSGLPAIVLAAGLSQRMGRLKMQLPFGDRPMLARVIESLRAASAVGAITVVTGHAEQEICVIAGEYAGVACAHNPDFAAGGMLSSVKAGVRALPESCAAFFLVLGDQPMVQPATLDALAAAWSACPAPVVTPTYGGKRGHPVLMSGALRLEICALGEDETLKTVMVRHAQSVMEVGTDDAATVMDVDTRADYEAALERWKAYR